jgi:hypothetical protein
VRNTNQLPSEPQARTEHDERKKKLVRYKITLVHLLTCRLWDSRGERSLLAAGASELFASDGCDSLSEFSSTEAAVWS